MGYFCIRNNMLKTILKRLPHTVFIACMAMLFGCSAGSSSGGIYKQVFNISGQWSGQIGDGNLLRNFTATLNDNAGTVTGTMTVTDHSCFAGATIAGTATGAGVNTTGDNPDSTDQENSNDGNSNLVLTVVESYGGEDVTRTTTMDLTGNSSSLTGTYNGDWIPQTDAGGENLKIPGNDVATCRNEISGSISLLKL